MKISYNWLKNYIKPVPSPEKCSQLLTNTGLEVEGTETIDTIAGGLRGLVVGEVLSCIPHPNADRLKVTQVDTGSGTPAQIVCGAPNVAAGQKVIVALPGAELHPSGGDAFVIKKSKIRGEFSEGMICAEDEIGLGKSHDGIMVLPSDTQVGKPAAEYFGVEQDIVFEIGLTPNRTDAMSHFGVARDLRAALYLDSNYELSIPEVEDLSAGTAKMPVNVEIEDVTGLKRYSGLCIGEIKVQASPDWLQNALRAIGQRPVNNIVDITNYVMFESGQPLHAFDLAEVKGNTIRVGTCAEGSDFITLDGVKRKLGATDLMILNAQEPMCIAGVFGGLNSGVKDSTTGIFLESACFDAVRVRKTSKFHGLKTDSSFRFERGTDPEACVYALERAASLIFEIAGGRQNGGVFDWYPEPLEWKGIQLRWTSLDKLVGEKIDREEAKSILNHLGFRIETESVTGLKLSVPPFKTDVTLEADVVEEILRIYGYNRIAIPEQFKAAINLTDSTLTWKLRNQVSDRLSGLGFAEILNNSLIAEAGLALLPADGTEAVKLLNPLSNELNVLRKSMLNTMCESLAWNMNRQQNQLAFYEWGSVYSFSEGKFRETEMLSLALAGDMIPQNWHGKSTVSGYYSLKGILEGLLTQLGINPAELQLAEKQHPGLAPCFEISISKKTAGLIGCLSDTTRKAFDLNKGIWFAELNWKVLQKIRMKYKAVIVDPPRFPSVRRDLALVIDRGVQYGSLYETAFKTERKLLKEVNLFDVYQGEKLPEGKKSYALSFTLMDEAKTLTDKQVEKVMERLLEAFGSDWGAKLRD
ncbi:MAG: phenylalanine--tRNA ligase subunit beta [Bacteroidia bacterium]